MISFMVVFVCGFESFVFYDRSFALFELAPQKSRQTSISLASITLTSRIHLADFELNGIHCTPCTVHEFSGFKKAY